MREKCEKNDFLISYLRLWQYYELLDESNSVLKDLETWQRYWFTQILNLSVSQGSENWKWTILNFQKYHDTLKPSLFTKILSINDFITRLHSKLRELSNRVHLKSISMFINKVINRYCFFKCTLKNRSIYKNTVC